MERWWEGGDVIRSSPMPSAGRTGKFRGLRVVGHQILDAGGLRWRFQAEQHCNLVTSSSGALGLTRQDAVDQGWRHPMLLGPIGDADPRLPEFRAGSADLIGRKGSSMDSHVEIL